MQRSHAVQQFWGAALCLQQSYEQSATVATWIACKGGWCAGQLRPVFYGSK
jgi:hypothetical protein